MKSNEIIRGKLISEDGTLALIVLSLEPSVVSSKGLSATISEIRKLMKEDLGDTGLAVELSGVPVMQLEIRNAVERDGLIYNIAGILRAVSSRSYSFARYRSWLLRRFRRCWRFCWRWAARMGGFSLNMFLNVMTPLIMVISFSNSMQLTFAARDRLIGGRTSLRPSPMPFGWWARPVC